MSTLVQQQTGVIYEMNFVKLGVKRYHATTFFEDNSDLSYQYIIGLCYDCLNDLADTHRGLTGLALSQTDDFKSEVVFTPIQFGGKDGHSLKVRAGQLNDGTGWKPDAIFLQLGRNTQQQRKLEFQLRIVAAEEGITYEALIKRRDEMAINRVGQMQQRIQRSKDKTAFREGDVVILGTGVQTIKRIINGKAGVRASFKSRCEDVLIKDLVDCGVYTQDPVEALAKEVNVFSEGLRNCLWSETRRCEGIYTLEFINSISTHEQVRRRELLATEVARIAALERELEKAREVERKRVKALYYGTDKLVYCGRGRGGFPKYAKFPKCNGLVYKWMEEARVKQVAEEAARIAALPNGYVSEVGRPRIAASGKEVLDVKFYWNGELRKFSIPNNKFNRNLGIGDLAYQHTFPDGGTTFRFKEVV